MGINWLDFLAVIDTEPVPEKDLQRFRETWARRYVDDPAFRPVVSFSRVPKGDITDTYWAKTICTPTTIPNALTLVKRDWKTPPDSDAAAPTGTAAVDCIWLLDLGDDLNGFPNTAHGGVLCAIMDEALSVCVEIHRQRSTDGRTMLYTAYLTNHFRRPVVTPAVVAVKAHLQRRSGRKWFMKGHIEDEDGHVLVEADGLWVAAREDKL